MAFAITARQRGFTLIEVLVAMVILAMTYGVLLKIFGGAVRNTSRIEDYRTALVIAESTLALASRQAGAARAGNAGEKFQWHTTIEDLEGAGPAGFAVSDGPQLVTVTVSWDSGSDHPHKVELSTIRVPGAVR